MVVEASSAFTACCHVRGEDSCPGAYKFGTAQITIFSMSVTCAVTTEWVIAVENYKGITARRRHDAVAAYPIFRPSLDLQTLGYWNKR